MDVNEKMMAVFETKEAAGLAAGKAIEMQITDLLKVQEEVRIIFAAAPSQNETLDYLVNSTKIPWEKIIAFNMDEYIGLSDDAEQLFSNYLMERIFNKVKVKKLHLIDPKNSVENEIKRMTKLIHNAVIDIIILGIGQNGHIAFNDPPVADFEDSAVIKQVELDQVCRQQQVNDKCFLTIDEVPSQALTLTIPTIMSGKHLFCIVSGQHKAEAVYQTLHGEISINWPSTILRTHPDCKFYFDKNAYNYG